MRDDVVMMDRPGNEEVSTQACTVECDGRLKEDKFNTPTSFTNIPRELRKAVTFHVDLERQSRSRAYFCPVLFTAGKILKALKSQRTKLRSHEEGYASFGALPIFGCHDSAS